MRRSDSLAARGAIAIIEVALDCESVKPSEREFSELTVRDEVFVPYRAPVI